MTKEQEAIEYLEESVLIYKNTIPKISKAIETVLNMLKEKDEEIESLEKTLDEKYIFVTGARTLYAGLMSLDKENIVKDDLKLRNEIYQYIEDKEKKDKIIDLMAEKIDQLGRDYDDFCMDTVWDEDCDEDCKNCIKQYFEREAKSDK